MHVKLYFQFVETFIFKMYSTLYFVLNFELYVIQVLVANKVIQRKLLYIIISYIYTAVYNNNIC